jgi:nitroreductase
MGILPAITARWSAKRFLPRRVSDQHVERILHAGRLAPSAKNRQEWRFIVVSKSDLRAKLADAAFGAEQIATAPVIIAVCTTNIDYCMPNGQLSYQVDLSIAAAFMMLQAAHEGIGSSAMTTFDEQEVQDLLSIPHAMRVVVMLALGYTDQEPPARVRKALPDIVAYEHW